MAWKGIDGLYVRDNVLYTDRERRQAPSPLSRPESKMAEWKIDWWLGRSIRNTAGKEYMVVGGEYNSANDYILSLENEDERVLRVPLVRANQAVRNGTWEVL